LKYFGPRYTQHNSNVVRELDERLGLSALIEGHLTDPRA
jgi:hypothetical protein